MSQPTDRLRSTADQIPEQTVRPGLPAPSDDPESSLADTRLRAGPPAQPAGGLDSQADTHLRAEQPSARREPASLPARGAVWGRYVVLSALGEGGMGTVLAAYDSELDRKVALKVLRQDVPGLEGPEARERLRREARSLARLSHPNVVTVYDVDTFDGQLFIAMELVEGRTLRTWLREEPRDWRHILAAYLDAGRGLAAAHSAGLVHRDFKPDNVLVGRDGRVRVTDFGLARPDQERSPDTSPAPQPADLLPRMTQVGALVGTPAYMAPEQRERKDATAASDQFSFCLSLQEALSDPPPGAVRGSSALRALPARARRALQRGLSLDPAGRFPSMDALLAELVRASGRTSGRWIAAALAVLLLAGGTGTAVYLSGSEARQCRVGAAAIEEAWGPARRESVRRAFEQSRLPYASSAWATVAGALDAYAASWKRGWTEACDATHVQGVQTPAILQQRTLCLAERKRALEALTRVLGRGEPVVIERAVDATGALPDLRGCADVGALAARPALPERPELRARVEQVRQQLADAFALKEAGKAAEGLPLGLAAVAESERIGFRPLEAEAQLLLAQIQEENGDYRGAEQSYGKASLRAEASRDAKVVLQAQTDLVLLLGDRLARLDDAREVAERASAVLEGVGGDPLAEAQLESHLGVLSYSEGDFERSAAHHGRAVSLREQGLGPDHPLVAVALNLSSTALIKLARYSEAQQALERALRIAETALGRDHPLSLEFVSNLGTLFLEQGRYAEGLVYTRRTLEAWEKSLAPNHPDLAIALTNHGRALRGVGEYAQARQAYLRAVQIREATLGLEHPLLATPLNNLGVICDLQGEDQAALGYYERALAIRKKALGPTHASVSETLVNLGGFHQQRGHFAQAISLYEEALRIDEKALGPDHPFLADEYVGMGECHLRLGNAAKALALLERSLVLREKRADPVETADAQWLLAQALVASGRDRERARTLAEKAREASAGAGTEEGSKLEAQVRAWIASTFGR